MAAHNRSPSQGRTADAPTPVLAFSDGGAQGNPGPGGYGVVLQYRTFERELSQGFRYTTNNRMELLGAIVALETLTRVCRVLLTTDSRYVVDGVNKGWAQRWRANGWRRKQDPVPNSDLWARLLEALARHDATLQWVRGHRGHPENERCDRLAVAAARGADLAIDRVYEQAKGRHRS